MAGILPQDVNKLGWGNAEAKAQRDQMSGDAKEFANGSPLDAGDGGPLKPASDMVKGRTLPAKGKSFGA